MTASREHRHGQLKIPAAIGRDLLEGEIVTRGLVEPSVARLPTSSADDVYGVLSEVGGAIAGQVLRVRFMRTGEHRVRIEDGASVALFDKLGPSIADPGSAVPSPSGIFATALGTLAGGTNQYVFADISGGAGGGGASASAIVEASTPDHSAAGTFFALSGPGTITAIYALNESFTSGVGTYTFAIQGVPVVVPALSIPNGSLAGFTKRVFPTAANVFTQPDFGFGNRLEITNDGGAAVGGKMTIYAEVTF